MGRRDSAVLEQFMAQLGYAVDQALDEYFTFRVDSDRLRRRGPERLRRDRDRRQRQHALLATLLDEDSVMQAEEESSRGAEYDPTRLRVETQAALDDLQAKVGNAWRWPLRLSARALAALFALAALIYVPVPPGSKLAALIGSFLLGGFFAGLFRDLAALIERFRRL